MDSKKKERPITSFFERKSRQVNENETPEPQINSSSVSPDANRIDSSDSVCTGKGSISSTTSPNLLLLLLLLLQILICPINRTNQGSKSFLSEKWGTRNEHLTQNGLTSSNFYITGKESDSVIRRACAVADNQNLLKTDTKKERTFIDKRFFKWTKF